MGLSLKKRRLRGDLLSPQLPDRTAQLGMGWALLPRDRDRIKRNGFKPALLEELYPGY